MKINKIYAIHYTSDGNVLNEKKLLNQNVEAKKVFDGNKVIEILSAYQLPFNGVRKRCMPVYRDLIVLRDGKGNLLNDIEICFTCESILLKTQGEVSLNNGGYEAFKKLLNYEK